MDKKRRIEQQLVRIEQQLANAAAYVARGVNVEGSAFLHLDDWKGHSGHPLWTKNFMIPRVKRGRARKEMALGRITNDEREKRLQERRRRELEPDLTSRCRCPVGPTAVLAFLISRRILTLNPARPLAGN